MIKKQALNSGRGRGQMNSTTLRQEANGSNAGGRILIKKTVSPTNESSFNINNQLSVASNSNNIT